MGDTRVTWQSVRWQDGSSFEGLVNDNELCHVRGVFRYPGGDRYEGEYFENHMQGFGVYVWKDGTVYRGQWNNSKMDGCGVKISRQPNGAFLAEEGQFVKDEWVGDAMACSVEQARAAAAEADIAAQMARVFELRNEAEQAPAKSSSAPGGGAQQRRGQGGAPQKQEGGPLAFFTDLVSNLKAKLPVGKQ